MEKTIRTILVGADHRGWQMKEDLKRSLSEWGYLVFDVGTRAYEGEDDYPDIAYAAALKVVQENSQGILICGSGVGMAVVANKVPGIRAALCASPEQAAAARHDDDANVLVLAADFLTAAQARRIAKVWLETEFVPKEKYVRRLRKITLIEKQNLSKNFEAQRNNSKIKSQNSKVQFKS
ncbi:MAG: RpiB/LacA/LacB family sugar-phosphate isomerase [Patescibacteria group bacterium]